MCDCYWRECEECEVEIPIHIGDYAFPRIDVEAWCQEHIPDAPGVEVFVMTKDADGDGFSEGVKFGLRLCDGEKRPSEHDVNINIYECDVDKNHVYSSVVKCKDATWRKRMGKGGDDD